MFIKIINIVLLFFFTNILFSINIVNDIRKNIETIYSFGKRDIFSSGRDKTFYFLKNKFKSYNYDIKEYLFSYNINHIRIEGKNLFAYRDNGSDFIIIAAHYDSKYFKDFSFLGANDNISGIVATIAIAGILKDKFELLKDISLGFLFIDMEESIFRWSSSDGLYGSRKQVDLWTKDNFIKRIKYFILLDMVGDPDTVFCKEVNSDPDLTNKIWEYASRFGYTFFKNCYSNIEDDHIPFIKSGVKSTDIIPYPFPWYWHTQYDTIDKISPDFIATISVFISNFILNEIK
ncbi:MAG TPA: M28 family metallopeptidase [Spirochaetota bacterium]|nr:M28 family metallopeptidase [Spirochaetota bacterium]HOM38487.1 M28 family metallopeptidase [Spirochaetota bacterium]HPQ49027.1 M28 family metallopeptidase [Spirochaetota bacterium]